MRRSLIQSALPAIRASGARRLNSSTSGGAITLPVLSETGLEATFLPFRHAKIKSGTTAYVWDVPKDLPENEFVRTKRAVAEHAACELERLT